MSRPGSWSGARRLSVVASAIVALALFALLGGAGAATSTRSNAACGGAATATIAVVDATAANDIYGNELAGTEVSFDSAQITGAADLLSAVAADDRAAALAAVSRIVYHPAWHIVRLRVLDAAGRMLADVGGPYVIAPVSGALRSNGRVVGSFVMSVQDDTGYTKLETRFIGDPVGIYVDRRLVAERYGAFPSAPPSGSSLRVGGAADLVVAETYRAFPSGTLAAVMLVPPSSPSLQRQSCTQLRAGEFGRIAERFARLAVSLAQHWGGFAKTVQLYTGAEVFVRDGSRQLASSGGSGPPALPSSGTVSYRGRSWLVFSFRPLASTRVYILAPPA